MAGFRRNQWPACIGISGRFASDYAPVVWEGRVFIGNAGSDYGGIGHIRAFEANTGKRLWNFDTVPSGGEAAKTWPQAPNRFKAGGGTYSSYALDTEAGLLYSPVGNPGPDFVRDRRLMPPSTTFLQTTGMWSR